MGHLLLTGATGLVGSYLVRDFLRTETRLAVLVRPTKFATAKQRIETLVARWEKQVGYSLPRPVVLEGDITSPNLRLGDEATRWVSENCTAFMHNAASLTFQAESPDGEPWRSNLEGTRNVLAFTRNTGIREFHHVSTAYVCGLRTDRVFEHELDVGQTHGNDYEISKFQSEQLVRSADHLDEVTVYRPGIIVGDSQTGFTTTYHGFYVPLKLVSTIISKAGRVGISPEQLVSEIRESSARLREVLKLTGEESKNYVPVEWCSAVMSHVYTHREHHGKTYHLTPLRRASVAMTQQVMEEAFIKYNEKLPPPVTGGVDWAQFEQFFIDGMEVYRSYWRDDPEFDCSNTVAAAPHLPCPDLDAAMFMRLCRFAIDANFGWPRPPEIKPEFDVQEHLGTILADRNSLTEASNNHHFVGLQVNGRGGGQWELMLADGQVVGATPGLSRRCTATYYMNSNTFRKLATDESTVEQAINAGRVLIEGNGLPLGDLTRALDHAAGRNR